MVGRVVHEHVARLDALAALLEAAQDAAHVARDGAELQRRGVGRLGQLAPLRVEQRGAEVLGLADDRGVAHARQPPAHLQGDRLQRAAQHLGVDGADRRGAHRAPPTGTIRLPASSASRAVARRHDQRGVGLHDDRRALDDGRRARSRARSTTAARARSPPKTTSRSPTARVAAARPRRGSGRRRRCGRCPSPARRRARSGCRGSRGRTRGGGGRGRRPRPRRGGSGSTGTRSS